MPKRVHVTTEADPVDALRLTERVIAAGIRDLLRDLDMTEARLALLRFLASTDEKMGCTQIGDKLGCTRQNIEQMVDRLIPLGWVEVLTYERRLWQRDIAITEAGRVALSDAIAVVTRFSERVRSRIQDCSDKPLLAHLEEVKRAALGVKATRGEVKRVEGKVHPSAFLDFYVTREVQRFMKREAALERWEAMPRMVRAAHQHAELYGQTVEEILEEWRLDANGEPLAPQNASAPQASSAGGAEPASREAQSICE